MSTSTWSHCSQLKLLNVLLSIFKIQVFASDGQGYLELLI